MNALMMSRLPTNTAHEVLVTGKRFGGEEAAAKGIVTEAVAEDQVLPRAIEVAAELAPKADQAMGVIKARMYAEALALLAGDRS